jgi:uncharacterized protein (DUF1800 family)
LLLKTPTEAISILLNYSAFTNFPIDLLPNITWVAATTSPASSPASDDVNLPGHVIGWMLDNLRMDNTIRSKMILFLHQNWMVDDESWISQNMYHYLKLLEFYSLGSYKSLAKKMCRDNRMLVYLNGY